MRGGGAQISKLWPWTERNNMKWRWRLNIFFGEIFEKKISKNPKFFFQNFQKNFFFQKFSKNFFQIISKKNFQNFQKKNFSKIFKKKFFFKNFQKFFFSKIKKKAIFGAIFGAWHFRRRAPLIYILHIIFYIILMPWLKIEKNKQNVFNKNYPVYS